MRDIKFRAWDKLDRKMHLRVGIDYHAPARQLVGRESKKEMIANNRIEKALKNKLLTVNPFDSRCHYILMQYTGLKDKNGVEIYEGDIVNISNSHGVGLMTVEFIGSSFQLVHKKLRGLHASVADMLRSGAVEVIGNIYENPNLLKASSQNARASS